MELNQRLFALIVVLAMAAWTHAAATSEWVHPGPDGKLVYKTTEQGDRIMDFSHAGYMGGGVALPDVPVKKTVKPSGGQDDSAVIQKALDEVGAMPLVDGFRGAVLLEPGTYVCPDTISIQSSGVVLRGSGADANGSTLKLTGRPHPALAVRAPGGFGRGRGATSRPTAAGQPTTRARGAATQEVVLAETSVVDAYVPSGSMNFNVADSSEFKPGDRILIRRPVTEAWIKFMHMDDLVRNNKPQTWIRKGESIRQERTIARVSGKTITLDVPLSDSLDSSFASPGITVAKIKPPPRVSQCGVENLHIESPPQEINHTQPHFQALRINGEDCWARDIQIDETMNSVSTGGRRITLQRVSVNRKALHQGSSKPAEFAPNATQVLLDRCTVSADNVWFAATGAGVSGPIVLLNCTFRGAGRAESHQRWSTGQLYDNCRASEGGLEMRNRGSMGSGHGWTMGWGVFWNCQAKDFLLQNSPSALNWSIGCVGEHSAATRPWSGPQLPGGTVDSLGVRVAPASLYLTQLKQRLGPQALVNIGYPPDASLKPTPASDTGRAHGKMTPDKGDDAE